MARFRMKKERHNVFKRQECRRLQEESKTRELLELEQERLKRFLNGDFD